MNARKRAQRMWETWHQGKRQVHFSMVTLRCQHDFPKFGNLRQKYKHSGIALRFFLCDFCPWKEQGPLLLWKMNGTHKQGKLPICPEREISLLPGWQWQFRPFINIKTQNNGMFSLSNTLRKSIKPTCNFLRF